MADKLVESKIRCDKVTLFIERGCHYCRNAEEMFKQYNFVPGALEVVDITQRMDVQDYLQRRTGHRTVSSRSCSAALVSLQGQGTLIVTVAIRETAHATQHLHVLGSTREQAWRTCRGHTRGPYAGLSARSCSLAALGSCAWSISSTATKYFFTLLQPL
uniref:Glutaredoxin domain-containing protein n=1 Tax=Amazona collaria TaxID=241587 RepID=A0A8B9G304_9PSIT